MNKKKLILSSVLGALAVATLLIMLMPILTEVSTTPFDLVGKVSEWYYLEEYLWGIAGLIATICLPLLIITTDLCILSACGVIKSKKFDLILYIINIVLAFLCVGAIVNYFLGLGRTLGMGGLKLFKGETYFKYSSAFFYLYSVFSIAMLVITILNRKWRKK